MAEVQVPNLNIAAGTTVATARGGIDSTQFGVAVVQAVTGNPNEINQMTVTKQEPTPTALLTAGEIMHIYVAGAGGGGTKTVTPPAGNSKPITPAHLIS